MSDTRYCGRSIGRMLQFLREYTPWIHDRLIFGEKITLGHDGPVVCEVSWDKYDVPTFKFTEEYKNSQEIQEQKIDQLIEAERDKIAYLLERHDEDTVWLATIAGGNGTYEFRCNSRELDDKHTYLKRLEDLGLITKREKQFHGFTRFGDGQYLEYTYEFKTTPEGKGMIKYLGTE